MPKEQQWAPRNPNRSPDRFHLILNLSATMERVLEERSRQLVLPPAEDAATDPVLPCRDSESDAGATPPKATSAQLRRQRRLDRYEQVVSMFNSGQSQAAIARTLGMEEDDLTVASRRTVSRAETASPPAA